MKGKREFTKREAERILQLIEEKLKTEKSKQVNVRNKIRALGFYWSDFDIPKRKDGYNEEDFLSVVKVKK